MTRVQKTCSLRDNVSLELLLPYYILTIFIVVLLLRGIVDIVKGTRSSLEELCESRCYFTDDLAIKSTPYYRRHLLPLACNENVPRLLLQQLRCYLSPLDVW